MRRDADPERSRRPTGSWPSRITPTRTRATPRPRQLQGGGRGLRGPLRPEKRQRLRPLRARRARGGRRPRLPQRRDIMSAFGDIFGGGLFGDLFGQRRRGPRARTCLMKLEIDLIEAARGTTKPIEVDPPGVLRRVLGLRAPARGPSPTCTYCGGRGQVVQSRGFFQVATTCPACGGEGVGITDPCPSCRGTAACRPVAHAEGRRAAGRRERDVAPTAEPGRAGRPRRPPGQPPDPDPGPQAPVLRASNATT